MSRLGTHALRSMVLVAVAALTMMVVPAVAVAEDLIAFTGADEGTLNVCTINADGSGFAALTDDSVSLAPAWSPDGSRIAYVRLTEPYYGTPREIWTMAADGTDKQLLVRWQQVLGEDVVSPLAWSPDGRYLAFTDRDPDEDLSRVIRYELSTGEWSVFWIDQYFAGISDLAWSPDGTELAIVGYTEDGTDCVVVDEAGDVRFQPTLPDSLGPCAVSWSATTGAIAYTWLYPGSKAT